MSEWQALFEAELAERYSALLKQAEQRARKLGLHEWLWPFQFQDVCRASLKQHLLLAYQMGLGKTRAAIALGLLHGSREILIVAPKKLWGEWVNEVAELGLLGKFQIIENLADAQRERKLNLVSLTDLWRIPKDSPKRKLGQAHYKQKQQGDTVKTEFSVKYSLAWHLRKRFGTVVVDEAYTMKDVETNQSKAVQTLRARHKVLLTGTPVRGYPNNILSLLNWAFGNGSDIWPEYSFYVEGAVQKFLDRFGTYVYYDERHRRTASSGQKKLLPKIADPEEFQRMLAPKMIRRLNTEPEVRAVVQIPQPELHYEALKMDARHQLAYQKVLENFRRWFERAEREAWAENREIRRNEILVQLTALIGCASFPQLVDEEWAKSGEPTAKQQRALDLIEEYSQEQRKLLVLSRSVDGARWLFRQLEQRKIGAMYIDGSVPLTWDRKKWSSKRLERIKVARREEWCQVLVATTPCIAEGLNLPEFSAAVFLDYDWVPSVMAQAFSRMLRPQQQRDVQVHFLTCKGTIEEYMELLCYCKQRSIAEGLDYETYDFNLEDLPDIRAYAKALVTDRDVLSRYQRQRHLVTNTEVELAV